MTRKKQRSRLFDAARVGLIVILVTLSSRPAVSQQLRPSPPPSRISEIGTISVLFTADASQNDPSGDNTMIVAGLELRRRSVGRLGPVEWAIDGRLEVGASYREDTVAENRLRVEKNRIRIDGSLRIPLGWRVDPYASFSLETHPTESFRYGRSGRDRIAAFWDPVVTTQGFGGAVILRDTTLEVEGGLALAMMQTRAEDHSIKTDDRSTPEIVELYKAETGIEVSGRTVFEIDSGRGRIEMSARLFGTFEDLGVWSLDNENRIHLRLADYLTFAWTIGIRHDVDESLRTQFASGMSFGLSGEI